MDSDWMSEDGLVVVNNDHVRVCHKTHGPKCMRQSKAMC